jgi:preprotein translocase subunit SecG
MKKVFAILLTLLMIMALPLSVMADEAVTSHDPSETAEDIVLTIGGEANDEAIEETKADSGEEDAPKTRFGFFPETLSETLPVMGMGMLGIFLVICVIVLAVIILSKIGKKDEED